MSEDIVDTLRRTRLVWTHNEIDYLVMDDVGLLFKAADEIERLRNDYRRVTEFLEWYEKGKLKNDE